MRVLNKVLGSNAALIYFFAFAILISVAFALVPKGVGASVQNAQAYANQFCPRDGEVALADYMWITNPQGGDTFNVTEGQSQQVDVTLNVYVTYCAYWGSTAAKAISINAGEDTNGDNVPDNGLMSGQPSQVQYPRATNLPGYQWGKRITWGPATYSAKLNVSGWAAGSHRVCTTFATVSIYPSYVSPSGCTTVNLTRTSPWTTAGRSLIGVGATQTPNVVTWPANPPGVPTAPGSILRWNHRLWNNSGYDMNRTIYWSVRQSGFSGAASWRNGSADPQGWNSGSANGSVDRPFVNEGPAWNATQYRVTQDDVGHTLCQWLVWTPNAYNKTIDTAAGTSRSPAACTTVPYNFNLTPSIDPLGKEFGDQGGAIPTVSGKITNSGPTKSYTDTIWQLSKIIVRPGGSIEETRQIDDRQDGCAYYRNDCTRIDGRGSGEGDSSFGVKATVVRQLLNEQIGDLEVGSKLCYGMSVKAYNRNLTNSSPEWRHSPAECVIIGKKPKVQVWGSDLSVGRRFANDTSATQSSNVETSKSIKDGGTKTFGSWVEYGVFAPGTIDGASSAAGLAGQDGNSSSNQTDWSRLTFANGGHTATSGCNGTVRFGCFAKPGAMGAIPDVAARLAPKATNSTPQLNGSPIDTLSGTYYANGSPTISGGTIAKGRSVVIKAAGTVRISGNINYTTDRLSSISEIPQVVIIANQIIIDEGVTNVDAWLIANGTSGSIYTCGAFKATLTSKVCDQRLTVNGPVMAKKLFLQRTAGSGTGAASGEPAEVLNLRSDAYLWAINQAGGQGSVRTLETKELAPRF